MRNFEMHNTVRLIFGPGSTDRLKEEAEKLGKSCLIVTGKESIKKTGLFDRIMGMLDETEIDVFVLEGVKSNPVLEKVQQGIDFVKMHNIDFIIAAGGGSVIDTAKAIGIGAKHDCDVWDFYCGSAKPQDTVPVMVLLTIAATGSEMNSISVITNEDEKKKIGMGHPVMYPALSILDPELTLTVPWNYTAYSSVDIIAHAIEGYFTAEDSNVPVQDGFVETIVRTVIDNTRILKKDPADINARTNIMWCSTLALNGILTAGIGRYEFQNHVIGHAMGALFDVPHGAALSVIMPAWMKTERDRRKEKFAKFGREIFSICGNDDEASAGMIEAFEAFLKEIEAPVKLSQVGIDEITDELIENAVETANARSIRFDFDYIKGVYEKAR